MKLLLVLLAAAAVYLSAWTLGKHGINPQAQEFWLCTVPTFAAGAIVVLISRIKGKKPE